MDEALICGSSATIHAQPQRRGGSQDALVFTAALDRPRRSYPGVIAEGVDELHYDRSKLVTTSSSLDIVRSSGGRSPGGPQQQQEQEQQEEQQRQRQQRRQRQAGLPSRHRSSLGLGLGSRQSSRPQPQPVVLHTHTNTWSRQATVATVQSQSQSQSAAGGGWHQQQDASSGRHGWQDTPPGGPQPPQTTRRRTLLTTTSSTRPVAARSDETDPETTTTRLPAVSSRVGGGGLGGGVSHRCRLGPSPSPSPSRGLDDRSAGDYDDARAITPMRIGAGTEKKAIIETAAAVAKVEQAGMLVSATAEAKFVSSSSTVVASSAAACIGGDGGTGGSLSSDFQDRCSVSSNGRGRRPDSTGGFIATTDRNLRNTTSVSSRVGGRGGASTDPRASATAAATRRGRGLTSSPVAAIASSATTATTTATARCSGKSATATTSFAAAAAASTASTTVAAKTKWQRAAAKAGVKSATATGVATGAAAAAAKGGKDFGSHARDMHGKKHDLAALRARRNRAIFKGMKWMAALLTKNNHKILYDIGDDAPNIFFEIWYTSANSTIRTQAKGIAKTLTEKLEERLLKNAEVSRDAFFEAMFMLRIKNEMELDCGALLAHSDKIWARLNFKDTGKLFGVTKDELGGVSVEDWLMLLMRILIMDYNNILFRNRWRTSYGMKEAFVMLRSLELAPPPPGVPAEQCPGDVFRAFHDSFYLATHIIFGFSAYSAIKTSNADCPWVYTYIRKCLRYWMKMARLRGKGEQRQKTAEAEAEAEAEAASAPKEEEEEEEEEDSDEIDVAELQEGEDEGEGKSGDGGKDDLEDKGEGEGEGESEGSSSSAVKGAAVARAATARASAAKEAKMNGVGGGGEHVYVDIDGVGEIVDCLRGLGLTEASDPMVCQGTVWLLDQQAKNGSWPSIFAGGKKGTGVYDKLHPTWVCTQALRDRDFQIKRNQPWQNFIEKLVRDTNIGTLQYKPKW